MPGRRGKRLSAVLFSESRVVDERRLGWSGIVLYIWCMKRDYFEGADIAVTICAKDGTILDMNQKSRKTFLKPGREEIIGHNVLDCHPEPARTLLNDMLKKPRTNIYTVEKEGLKKLIFQTPWYDGDEYAGFMELSIVLPESIPNRVRKPKAE